MQVKSREEVKRKKQIYDMLYLEVKCHGTL